MRGRPFALLVYVRERRAPFKPVLPLHLLCGQLLSAAVATAAKHVSARFGAHSLAEAVYLASLSFFRLVGLFHFRSSVQAAYAAQIISRIKFAYL